MATMGEAFDMVENLTEELCAKEDKIIALEKDVSRLDTIAKNINQENRFYKEFGHLIFGHHDSPTETLEDDIVRIANEKTWWTYEDKVKFIQLYVDHQLGGDPVWNNCIETEQNVRDFIEDEYEVWLVYRGKDDDSEIDPDNDEVGNFRRSRNGEALGHWKFEIEGDYNIDIEYIYELPFTNDKGETMYICVH